MNSKSMWRIKYPPEAITLSEAIFKGLALAGYQEFVDSSREQITKTEDRILFFLDRISKLSRTGDPFSAYGILGRDILSRPMDRQYLSRIGIQQEMTMGEFLTIAKKLRSSSPKLIDSQLCSVLNTLLQELAPGGGYRPRIPFNVVYALNALVQVVVLPRRCFDYASNVFHSLGTELEIIDTNGKRVYGRVEHKGTSIAEKSVWKLWRKCNSVWRIDKFQKEIEEALHTKKAIPRRSQAPRMRTYPTIAFPKQTTSLFDVKVQYAAIIRQIQLVHAA